MPFYALSLMPLVHELHGAVKQIWYADDAQATGKLIALRGWWDSLIARGPGFGYFVNATKTILVVKGAQMDEAAQVFSGTGITISEGARDLGGAIGSEGFISEFVTKKVSALCTEMEVLSSIAVSSPHAAHAAFVHGFRHRWLFIQRTIPGVSHLFEPLENVIREKFIPALLGGQLVTDGERLMLSLPGRYGGFSIDNPTSSSSGNYTASSRLSQQLIEHLLEQRQCLCIDQTKQHEVRQAIYSERKQLHEEYTQTLQKILPHDKFRALLAAQEKGGSVLVTTLPLKKFNFALSKQEFRDQLLMRYRWPVPDLPTKCSCGKQFTIDHSQICHLGGFVNMRHDEIRDLLATQMREVLKDVETEPKLTPLSGETLHPRTAIATDDARTDIRARGFWTRQQNAFFDVRVFYPHAESYVSRSMSSLYNTMEALKKRQYNDRVVQVEQGSFTPLVFSSTGGMGQETYKAIKQLAVCLADVRREPYSQVMGLLRCRIVFALIRASSVCLRGSRAARVRHDSEGSADLIVREARIDF
jgi:hypothetical protein